VVFREGGVISAVEGPDQSHLIPSRFVLKQNYPNPFNPETAIEYSVPKGEHVLLTVYNLAGQRIRTLVDGQQAPGKYTAKWNGRDEKGAIMPSGIYIYQVTADHYKESKRMVLMK
jgi:hypothetical protein